MATTEAASRASKAYNPRNTFQASDIDVK